MSNESVPGLWIMASDEAEAAREACARMVRVLREAIDTRGKATLALSGGSSPIGAYRRLAAEPLDFGRVHVFWVDERAVPPDHERSNYGGAKAALLDAAPIPPSNVHRMRGEDPDLGRAASAYEAELRAAVPAPGGGVPAFDLVVLGVGDDGHTASLFPGEDTVHVTDRLVVAVPAHGAREARLTLTRPVLEGAHASVAIVLGHTKHEALERIWAADGSVSATPARIVRGFRGALTWVVDRAACGLG